MIKRAFTVFAASHKNRGRTSEYTYVVLLLQGLASLEALLRCGEDRLGDVLRIDALFECAAADSFENHEANLAAQVLLVDGHQLEKPLGRERGAGNRQSGALEELAYAPDVRSADEAA